MTVRKMTDRAFGDYAADKDVNASALRAGRKSMLHMRAVIDGVAKEPSPAMLLGSALHAAILEPARFYEMVRVAPDVDRRTKAGKEKHAAFVASLPEGAIVLTADDYDAVRDAQLAVNASMLPNLMGAGESEVSVYWGEQCGDKVVGCKARIDWLGHLAGQPDQGIIIDIKTTRDASPSAFARSAAAYGYVHQAAWYMRAAARLNATGQGPKIADYFVVAVEMEAPYAVGLYRLSSDDLRAADLDNLETLQCWAAACEADQFPGPTGSTIRTLNVPEWVFRSANPTVSSVQDDLLDGDTTIPF
jgi:exodeoxyribonuclease VIII